MSRLAGVEIKYALKKAVTWGTAVACGAKDGFLALADSVKRAAPVEVDDSLGQYFSKDGTPGAVTVSGDIPPYLRYDGCDLLLALFMGSAGVPTQQDATAAYAYTYAFAENTDGLFATFARHMKNYVAEVPSLKIVGLTIKGETGKPLQLVAQTVGNDLVQDGVNDSTTFNNVTIAETSHRVHFAQGVFRMNDRDDIALAAGDVIKPSSFELSASRQLTGVYGAYTTAGANKQDLIDEPTNDGPPEITLKLQFPQHTGKTYLTDLGSDARKKMDIVFTGAEIESPYNRQIKIELPHLQMRSDDVVTEQGIIKEPLDFICHAIDAAPAGMDFTQPLRISGINTRTTDPLA